MGSLYVLFTPTHMMYLRLMGLLITVFLLALSWCTLRQLSLLTIFVYTSMLRVF